MHFEVDNPSLFYPLAPIISGKYQRLGSHFIPKHLSCFIIKISIAIDVFLYYPDFLCLRCPLSSTSSLSVHPVIHSCGQTPEDLDICKVLKFRFQAFDIESTETRKAGVHPACHY